MNMETWMQFIGAYRAFYGPGNDAEPLPFDSFKDKLSIAGAGSELSPEEFRRLSELKQRTISAYLREGLKRAKVFEIDVVPKRMMLLTDAPTDKDILRGLRLPFKSMFLDMDIDASEMDDEVEYDTIRGVLLMEMNEYDSFDNATAPIVEFVHDSLPQEERDKLGMKVTGRTLFVSFLAQKSDENGSPTSGLMTYFFKLEGDTEFHYGKKGEDDTRFLRRFIQNLLTFITHPEVEIVEHERTLKGNQRRIRDGKMPLPSSSRIRLTGKVKRWADHYSSELLSAKLTHRFWVRGHWRHHRSERYTEMQGKTIWIEPYLKGQGPLVEKPYAVEATKDSEREYKKNFLFLDDIKAAEKPMAQMRYEKNQRRRTA